MVTGRKSNNLHEKKHAIQREKEKMETLGTRAVMTTEVSWIVTRARCELQKHLGSGAAQQACPRSCISGR